MLVHIYYRILNESQSNIDALTAVLNSFVAAPEPKDN